ncbi:MAG: PEP-CTERM sorting domain-containing protein [Syntrophaceae bacterium]
MKKIAKVLIVAAFLIFMISGAVWADTINARPVSIPSGGSLDPLQAIFTSISSEINVYNDQEAAAIFTYAGSAVGTMFVASVSLGYDAEVGLYKYGSPATKLTLYNGVTEGYTPAKTVQIYFDALGNAKTIDPDTLTVIDSETGFGSQFGFYIKTDVYGSMYSEDSLNQSAQVLMFQGIANDLVNIGAYSNMNDLDHWYAAFEIANSGNFPWNQGNIDFNDAVVRFESINPVPEPGTILLLGLGLLGIGILRRKQ